MSSRRKAVLFYNKINITTALAVMVMFIFILFSACSGNHKKLGAAITERDSLPIMDTRGVTTLISDSGITRYRINTEEWQIYDRKSPSYWAFQKGIYLEKFDSVFNVEASIKADTAYYYDKKKLWELLGHVVIKNLKGETFNTEQLYWDQNRQKVYSDRFIRIEQPDKIITGRGFESNQQMTIYTIRKPEGIFYVNDESLSADTLRTDSVN